MRDTRLQGNLQRISNLRNGCGHHAILQCVQVVGTVIRSILRSAPLDQLSCFSGVCKNSDGGGCSDYYSLSTYENVCGVSAS